MDIIDYKIIRLACRNLKINKETIEKLVSEIYYLQDCLTESGIDAELLELED